MNNDNVIRGLKIGVTLTVVCKSIRTLCDDVIIQGNFACISHQTTICKELSERDTERQRFENYKFIVYLPQQDDGKLIISICLQNRDRQDYICKNAFFLTKFHGITL